VSFVDEGKKYKQSDKLGMIRLGSYTDIFIPKTLQITVRKGDKVRGGETTIAR
jgi:phosphatidylserine decarboxylase